MREKPVRAYLADTLARRRSAPVVAGNAQAAELSAQVR